MQFEEIFRSAHVLLKISANFIFRFPKEAILVYFEAEIFRFFYLISLMPLCQNRTTSSL